LAPTFKVAPTLNVSEPPVRTFVELEVKASTVIVFVSSEIVMEVGRVTAYAAPDKPAAVNSAAVTVPATEGRVPVPPSEVLSPVTLNTTVKFEPDAAMFPKLRSTAFVIEIGVTMFAAAWAVPVALLACPKEMLVKAKMATESVKNLRIVVFIMNILNCFLN
jgi:hypothetical protein